MTSLRVSTRSAVRQAMKLTQHPEGGGGVTIRANLTGHKSGSYGAYLGMWYVYIDPDFKQGDDFDCQVQYYSSFPDRTAISWKVPATPPEFAGVYGFLPLTYGNYDDSGPLTPVTPRQIDLITQLTVDQDVTFTGDASTALLCEAWLTSTPHQSGTLTDKVAEVAMFPKTSADNIGYMDSSTPLGTWTDVGGKQWTLAVDRGTTPDFYMARPTDGAQVQGTLHFSDYLAHLVALGELTGGEWVNGIAMGPEPRMGSGKVVFNRFGVTMAGASAIPPTFLRGVNMAAQQSGYSSFSFPSYEMIDYFAGKGAAIMRFPLRMEFLQLVPGSGSLDATYVGLAKDRADYMLSKGITPLIEMHNFGRFQVGATIVSNAVSGGTTTIIGQDPGYTKQQFAALWALVHAAFNSQAVWFGVMNEPHGQDDAALRDTHNAALSALRAAGFRGPVLINGNGYNSYAWDAGAANRTYMAQIHDPLDNWLVDLHHYFDASSAGQSATLAADYLGKLKQFTAYARSAGLRAFVGECGGSNVQADNLSAMAELLIEVESNPDVYSGWTPWAATRGSDRAADLLQLLPSALQTGTASGTVVDRGMMDVLETYLARANVAPSFLAAPTISGAAVVGVTLTSMLGQPVGFPVPAVALQWYRDATPISGETGRTYTIATADIGHAISLRVSLSNSQGTASADSAATATVVSTTNWDATTKSATVALSNGNLTATRTGAGSGTSVAANNAASTGVRYCEMKPAAAASALRLGLVGVAYTAGAGSITMGIYITQGGVVWCNGAQLSSSITTIAANDVIGLIVDLDAKTVSFTKNGVAIGSTYSFALLTGPFRPAASFDFTGPVTVNFGDQAYAHDPAVGVGKW